MGVVSRSRVAVAIVPVTSVWPPWLIPTWTVATVRPALRTVASMSAGPAAPGRRKWKEDATAWRCGDSHSAARCSTAITYPPFMAWPMR